MTHNILTIETHLGGVQTNRAHLMLLVLLACTHIACVSQPSNPPFVIQRLGVELKGSDEEKIAQVMQYDLQTTITPQGTPIPLGNYDVHPIPGRFLTRPTTTPLQDFRLLMIRSSDTSGHISFLPFAQGQAQGTSRELLLLEVKQGSFINVAPVYRVTVDPVMNQIPPSLPTSLLAGDIAIQELEIESLGADATLDLAKVVPKNISAELAAQYKAEMVSSFARQYVSAIFGRHDEPLGIPMRSEKAEVGEGPGKKATFKVPGGSGSIAVEIKSLNTDGVTLLYRGESKRSVRYDSYATFDDDKYAVQVDRPESGNVLIITFYYFDNTQVAEFRFRRPKETAVTLDDVRAHIDELAVSIDATDLQVHFSHPQRDEQGFCLTAEELSALEDNTLGARLKDQIYLAAHYLTYQSDDKARAVLHENVMKDLLAKPQHRTALEDGYLLTCAASWLRAGQWATAANCYQDLASIYKYPGLYARLAYCMAQLGMKYFQDGGASVALSEAGPLFLSAKKSLIDEASVPDPSLGFVLSSTLIGEATSSSLTESKLKSWFNWVKTGQIHYKVEKANNELALRLMATDSSFAVWKPVWAPLSDFPGIRWKWYVEQHPTEDATGESGRNQPIQVLVGLDNLVVLHYVYDKNMQIGQRFYDHDEYRIFPPFPPLVFHYPNIVCDNRTDKNPGDIVIKDVLADFRACRAQFKELSALENPTRIIVVGIQANTQYPLGADSKPVLRNNKSDASIYGLKLMNKQDIAALEDAH